MKTFTILTILLYILSVENGYSQSQTLGCYVFPQFHGNYVSYVANINGGPTDLITIMQGDSFYISAYNLSICNIIDIDGPNNFHIRIYNSGQTPYLKDTGMYSVTAQPSFYFYKIIYGSQTTSIIENLKPEFSIFPNPANDKVYINLKEPRGSDVICTLYNALGKKVFSDTILKSILEYEIPVDYLSQGVYIIEIKSLQNKKGNIRRFVKM